MDEVSCNVDELPVLRQAFNEKNYGYVAGYFAAKKIKELGGIYLGRDVIVDLPMNFIRHLSFFLLSGQFQLYRTNLWWKKRTKYF